MSANPIYHLKDAYFFEVPKSLWRYEWKSLSEVPSFLTDGHPDVTDVNEFNRALDGKVLIPQPFGDCLLYTSPSPRDRTRSRMPSSA